MILQSGAAATLVCIATVAVCARGVSDSAYVSRPVPNSHVLLVPELQGGWAGWCLATSYRAGTRSGGTCGAVMRTSRGPIFANGGCEQDEMRIDVYALVTSKVAAVSVAGGAPVLTRTNSTLPDGLRTAAVEVLRRDGRPNISRGCPRITPLDAYGRPIDVRGKPGRPQAFKLPGAREWEAPVRPPAGACKFIAATLPGDLTAYEGAVTTRIRPYRGLGRALVSCVDTVYVHHGEDQFTAAVLLNASRPGETPPPLPGMKPLAGRRGIFEAPGCDNERAARRVPGAWLVVEEAGGGLRVPVEILEHLRATIHL